MTFFAVVGMIVVGGLALVGGAMLLFIVVAHDY